MAELRLKGRPASPGIAEGLPFRMPERDPLRRQQGTPDEEAQALREAIGAAIRHLAALSEAIEAEAAEMIGFQIAMLEDDALAEPALDHIASGLSAVDAWLNAMEAEIESYRLAEDEYFRARSADLEDMRDLVSERILGIETVTIPGDAIVLARDFQPSRFLSINWSKGGAILLSEGSPTSHVAMLARARGVPMIVGLGELPDIQSLVLVDGAQGEAVIAPEAQTRDHYRLRQDLARADDDAASALIRKPAITQDGTAISILINIADPAELDHVDKSICDGIGLVRTELLFGSGPSLPDEETQYRIYRRIVEWAEGRPVTIRTLDAGGDKPIAGLTIDGESNPFLGVRGIRLSFARPDIFRVQLRALARAAVHGNLKVMAPMITHPSEYQQFVMMMHEEVSALNAAGIAAQCPKLGMMVEVPAAAFAIEEFDAEFFSIGSNDLTQYVTAAGRDNGTVADLADPLHPAMRKLFSSLAQFGERSGREMSLCGDAAGDAALVPILIASGLRTLSMAPSLVGSVKLAISRMDLTQVETSK